MSGSSTFLQLYSGVSTGPALQRRPAPWGGGGLAGGVRKCACGGAAGPSGECEACHGKRLGALQRKEANTQAPNTVPSIVHDVLRSHGQPLDPATRAFVEPRFGHDFGHVRLHTDAQAAESARAVNALAYTVGPHVVFGVGQYAPQTAQGKQTVIHELTHVIQQSSHVRPGDPITLGDANSPHEHQAEAVSAHLGGAFPLSAAQTPQAASVRPAVLQRISPAAAAGAGAAVGAIAAIISFEAALAYGQSLATRFPGWLAALPNCPCHEADVTADPATWGRDKNPLLSWFHPGAASSYRSNATFTTVPGSAHGQQCTYDSSGNLITDGPGGGTPDSWSPNTNGAAHTWYDVASWQLLGWRIYNRYWQPNNGNSCASNQGDNTAMRRFSEFLP